MTTGAGESLNHSGTLELALPPADLAPVVTLPVGDTRPPARWSIAASAVAVIVALGLALSPLWYGFYDFTTWAPLSLAAIVLLLVVLIGRPSTMTRTGRFAAGWLIALLCLSAASMLWSESKEGAWTATNQLALYVVIFAVGLVGVRGRAGARTIVMILGAPALISSAVLTLEMLLGGGQGWFLAGRLDSPIGYINGTAGLLIMGVWPWVGLAHAGRRRSVRVGAMSAATLIAGTVVLTQSRAIVVATLAAAICVLAVSEHRVRMVVRLLLLLSGVGVSLHWTLAVYRASGPVQALPLPVGATRSAGLAILLGMAIAGVGELVVTLLADALPRASRARVARGFGWALCAAAVLGVGVGSVVALPKVAHQYERFRHDRVDQAAPDRFLDAGGFRYDLWRVALDEFVHHPAGGVGAGGYDDEYYRLRRNPQSVVVPHSLELQMAAELGIGGAVALLAFCGAILAAGRRRDTLAASDPVVRIGALGIFIAWLSATSVDWLYNIPGLAGSAFLAAALLLVPATRRVEDVTRSRRRRARIGLVVGLAGLAVMAASVGRQYAAARYASAGSALTVRRPVAALRLLRDAHQLDPYSLASLYDIASVYARLDDYGDARTTLLAAHRREPENYVPLALLGDLATRRDDLGTAAGAYARALRLDPRDPLLRGAAAAARAALERR